MNGYDGSLMGSINSVPEYLQYFGLPQNGAASTGIIFSIFQIGQMVGALFIWLADWRGRRLSIFIGCCGVVVGKMPSSFVEIEYNIDRC
jgi:MFS family permease